MKKLLVTGCNGQLGRAVNKVYENEKDYVIVNTDVDKLDITNIDAVMNLVSETKPYAIINCGAYTAVDACESDFDTAFKVNAIGPRNLAIAASANNAKMVHISTDYVFEGNATKPYREYDATNPQGAYGKTKLIGEEFVKQFSKEYFIIRTAWLYGDGKNFVKTMLRLSETNPVVRVVMDQVGSPTSADELAKAIKILVPTDNYGTFHGTCEGQCSWADFTREIFRIKGISTTVEGIPTSEYPTPTKRPAYSVLENYMFDMTTNHKFSEWEEAIRNYLG